MDLAQFILEADQYWHANMSQRKGQAYFNYLDSVRPDIAGEIRGTEADPFYVATNLPAFCEKVAELL